VDLRNSEKAFFRLASQYDKIALDLHESGGLKVEQRVVNNVPQLADLEHDATIFLTSAKRALQSIAEVLNEFYGITIGNARFDIGEKQLKALNPVPTDLLVTLDMFTPTIKRLLDLRNFQEHTPKKTIVENFKLTALCCWVLRKTESLSLHNRDGIGTTMKRKLHL
jgi:hypothetical protein